MQKGASCQQVKDRVQYKSMSFQRSGAYVPIERSGAYVPIAASHCKAQCPDLNVTET